MDILDSVVCLTLVLCITGQNHQNKQESTFENLLTISASQNPAPLGEDIVLNCKSGTTERFTATWLYDGLLLDDQPGLIIEDRTLTLAPFQHTQVGTYSCLDGDVLSNELLLEFEISQPTVQVNTAVPVLLGEDFMLTCVTQALDVSFIWYQESDRLAENGNLLISEMLDSNAGLYYCVVVVDGARVQSPMSEGVNIDFKVPQPTVVASTTTIGGTVFPVGADVWLDCRINYDLGASTPKIFWFKTGAMVQVDDAKYEVSDRGVLTVTAFGLSDAGAMSCLVEIQGRQSEPSGNLALTYSVPEVIIDTGTREYDSSTLEPIMLGTTIRMVCVKDLPSLSYGEVEWSFDSALRFVGDEVLGDMPMDVDYHGNITCLVNYANSHWTSATSPVLQLTYAVPKPRVGTIDDRSVFYAHEKVTLYCESGYNESKAQGNIFRRRIWSKDGNGTADEKVDVDDNSLTINSFTEDFEGSYSCSDEINGISSEESDLFNISFAVTQPYITLNGESPALFGTEFGFVCESKYYEHYDIYDPHIIWFHNGVLVDSRTRDSISVHTTNLTIKNFQQVDIGRYQCAVEVHGRISGKSINRTMESVVPSITMTALNIDSDVLMMSPVGLSGFSTFTLLCGDGDVEGGNSFQFEWLQGITSSTTFTDTFEGSANGSPGDSFEFRCKKVYALGLMSDFSPTFVVMIAEVPMPQIIVADGTTFILGTEVTLTCYNNHIDHSLISSSKWFKNNVEIASPPTHTAFGILTVTFQVYHYADVARYSCINMVGGQPSIMSDQYTTEYKVFQPSVSADESSVSIGGTIRLECVSYFPVNSIPADIHWFRDEILVSADSYYVLDGVVLRVHNFQPHHCGSYQCIEYVGAVHSNISDALVLKSFVPAPGIRPNVPVVSEFLGDSFKLFCGSQVPIDSVQWRKDASTLSWDNLNLTKVLTATDMGVYACRVGVDTLWSDWSEGQNVTFEVPAPEIQPEETSVSILLGASLELFCGTQVPFTRVEWKKKNDIVSDVTQTMARDMRPSDTGTYACRVSLDDVWSEWSSVQNVTYEVPKPTVVADKNDVILGGSVTMTCVSSYENDKVTKRKYEWVLNNGKNITADYVIDNHILRIPVMTRAVARAYRCAESIANIRSQNSARTYVRFFVPRPRLTASSTAVPLNKEVQLTCIRGYDTMGEKSKIIWFKANETLDIDSNSLYQNDTDLQIIDFSFEDEGLYQCQEKVKGTFSERSVNVSLFAVVPTPSVQVLHGEGIVTSSLAIKLGSYFNVSCQTISSNFSDDYEFIWRKNTVVLSDETNSSTLYAGEMSLDDADIYSCRVYVPFMDRTSEWSPELTIDFNVPSPSIIYKTTSPMLGDSFYLECLSGYEKEHNSSFLWYRDGDILDYETNGVLTKITAVADDGVSYACQEEVRNTSSTRSQEVIMIFEVPSPSIIYKTTSPMLGDSFYLECLSGYEKEHNSSFLWYRDGDILDYETNGVLTKITAVADDGVSYACQEELRNTSSTRSQEVIMIFEVPAPVVQSEPISARVGESVVLKCLSQVNVSPRGTTENTPSNFLWFFGDQFLNETSSVLEVNDLQTHSTGPFQCHERIGSIMSGPSNSLSIEIRYDNSSYTDNNCTQDNSLAAGDLIPVMRPTSQSSVPEGSTITLRCEYHYNESYADRFYWYKDHVHLRSINTSTVVIKSFTQSYDGNYSCAILHNGGFMHSASFLLKTVDAHALCSCPCRNTTRNVIINETEIEEMVSSIKKNLTVDTSSLSSKVRAKTSAPDSRPASVSVGSVAVCLLILVPAIVVSFDCINLIAYWTTRIEYGA